MSWLNSSKKGSSSVDKLALEIMDVSYKCGQEFKKSIDEKFGESSEEAMTRWIQLQYEFLFFFTHLTMRLVLSKLGNKKRVRLQNLLGPILVETTTEAWFGHWPSKLKQGIKNNFYYNLNIAELKYSKCNKLFPDKFDDGFKNALLWELGMNIARLSGYENNPAVVIQSIEITSKRYTKMNLEKLVEEAGKEI